MTRMEKVRWGIIGCGDVAEVKSGPAFQQLDNSMLVAVMRRNGDKAKDFAKRHKVSLWSNDADELIYHTDIDALYIATPPSTHLEYALRALEANKNVYLEKPMALTSEEASQICKAAEQSDAKIAVAHYRRRLPAFLKVKQLIEANVIGTVQFADIQILQPPKTDMIADTDDNWRLRPEISGGGYFYDIAPHQIDLMYHFFGDFAEIKGCATAYPDRSSVAHTVNGVIAFKSGIQFRGIWNFSAVEANKKDECTIYGTEGKIVFSFYGEAVQLFTNDGMEEFTFQNPKHIQQPMIASVNDYFLGKGSNPCSAEEGLVVMRALQQLKGG
ncbi:Gfo/Idh/MocA family oxidoreductase [Aggregatimonas sangjinii]|uniref:Gfo/Idh/MocA family oxidoreductase n=2 Tax=Aggregatimonas sangjinii TaxID=2583587 RepID=A0A5B7ST38_9FLAO|nr:Gfo/Idh/MocA family oxidoreductase [Aggregatimonas sangjinii]